jgi:mannose-6-phosphate isomerase-like protein (cupin superfamily)
MTVIEPGGGEVVGDAPERRVEILCDHDALHATWTRYGPRREGADLHVHRRHTDLFYVLEGELTLRLGVEDELVAVPAGCLVRVPPLVVHGFRNGAEGELRYLNFHAPGERFADYLRAMRDGRRFSYDQEPPPAHGARPITDAVIGGVELHGPIEEIAIAELTELDGAERVNDAGVEAFYVLEGALAVRVDGRERRGGAGAWVQVAAGVPYSVAATGPSRVLHVRAPGQRSS